MKIISQSRRICRYFSGNPSALGRVFYRLRKAFDAPCPALPRRQRDSRSFFAKKHIIYLHFLRYCSKLSVF